MGKPCSFMQFIRRCLLSHARCIWICIFWLQHGGTRNTLQRTQCNQVTVWMLLTIWRCHQHSSNLIMSSEDWECKKLTIVDWNHKKTVASFLGLPSSVCIWYNTWKCKWGRHGSINDVKWMGGGCRSTLASSPGPSPQKRSLVHTFYVCKVFRYIFCKKLCALPCPNGEDYTNQEYIAF